MTNRWVVRALIVVVLAAGPAAARTPTPTVTLTPTITLTPSITPTDTFGPSPTVTDTPEDTPLPTATTTGTPVSPAVVIFVQPQAARSGQRVVLDGHYSRLPSHFVWTQIDGPPLTIEDADQALAWFVVPPLVAPTTATVQLDIGGTAQTAENALYPGNTVLVQIGQANVAPGGVGTVDIVLNPLGLGVTALTHELRFERNAMVVANPDGTPDCAPATPDLPIDTSRFVFTPDGCTPGTDCTGVRAMLTASAPLPPARTVYQCQIVSPFDSDAGCNFALHCGDGDGRDLDGQTLSIVCSDGSVSVNYVYAEPHVTLRTEPANPMVGDHVELFFDVVGEGGLPTYRLEGADPILAVDSGPPPSSGPLGTVRFTAVADCPGTAQLYLWINYEGRLGCPGNSFFGFRTFFSSFPLVIREAGTAVVQGRVGAGRDCSDVRIYTGVVLDPLGWHVLTDSVSGAFSFGGVPPGEYTVAVEGEQPDYPVEPVTVGDDDSLVDVTLCPAPPPAVCGGDCNGDGSVDIGELVRIVAIALNVGDANACAAGDSNDDATVAVDDLVRAVNNALSGCPS